MVYNNNNNDNKPYEKNSKLTLWLLDGKYLRKYFLIVNSFVQILLVWNYFFV